MTALTIDFHNTLVECDAWFELEVRSLVSSVLAWTDEHYRLPHRPVDPASADAAYRKLRLAIHHHGHELDATRSAATVLDRLGAHLPDAVIDEAIDALMLATLESAAPVKGARELLASVHGQGVPIAVVSSAVHHGFLEWALERFGMREHLQAVTTSASAGFYKSRPEIYWTAISALDASASTATHLGDSLRFDVGGAHMAGMRAIWFDRQANGTNGDAEPTPELVVSDLLASGPDILDLITVRR
ncbi:MAG: HAD family hydrolase [Thermomicrobiales bacterium]|jgi:FMN phosphatase YigB (HAD superfamily)|nr:HAD family hydrolase [Thermomicrobiales bacterium]